MSTPVFLQSGMRRRPFLEGLAGLLAVPSCTKGAYTRVTEIWHTAAPVSIQRLLVVGVWSKDSGQRGRFEERTAVAFRHADIPAMSAQALIGDPYPYPRHALVSAAEDNALDGALVVRLISDDRTARVDVTGEPLGPDPHARWTEHYLHAYQAEGVEPVRIVRVESLLFEVATEALVWSALSETFAPQDAADAVASYAEAMARTLVDGGWLRPSPSRSARTRRAGSALGMAGLLGGLLACQPATPPPSSPTPRPVKLLEVGSLRLHAQREWPGYVEPSQNAELSFDVPGKIVALDVDEGAPVARGQVLARLDDTDYAARLRAQRATLKQSRLEYQRDQELVAKEVVPKSELDLRERFVSVANAAVREAEKALADTELRAPFSGTIAKILVDNYQSVQAKQPIVVLHDASSLEIVTDVPERDLAAARPGLTVEQRNERISPHVRFDALPGLELPAELKEIATVPDPITRTYEVTWGFIPPGDVGVFPGMTAAIVLPSLERPGEPAGLFVPAQAVLGADEGGAYVWRIDPSSMTVHRADVTVGELVDDAIEVRSGLAPGDRIATSGVHELREALPVTDFDQVFGTVQDP